MFKKILVANRGEIACRVIRTLKKMGIQSVAIYSEADAGARHVLEADESVCVGPAPAAESYLNVSKILEVAKQLGVEAIHPGYGFLSENADFAESCEIAGIVFIGPTPQQMRDFGLKHTARELAQQNHVPLLPGSTLLNDAHHAKTEAERIGYPLMLKSTAGGGGIGMQLIRAEHELLSAFESVQRLSRANFKDAGIFLEKYVEAARHIEVQIFGNGMGKVIALGERDCSVQRRNQKVIEETPAPNLSEAARHSLWQTAVKLGGAIQYRSAGTVEFVYDKSNDEFYFLEVNTRLQVEHGVTELVTGIDLVEWMIRIAAGETDALDHYQGNAAIGHAIQVRIYAEDANKNFQPSCGLLTEVSFPHAARVDTWIKTGNEVSPFYDPLLAKILVHADNRVKAVKAMRQSLADTKIAGIETNLEYLRQILADKVFPAGEQTTRYLNDFVYLPNTIDVLDGGVMTTIQDYPGRVGYWHVGVPPSGPMDHLAFRLANKLVGNDEGTAGLEITLIGPGLKFNTDVLIAITGAPMQASLDDAPIAMWQSHLVKAGSVLKLDKINDAGCRSYLAVKGGFDVPDYLGSKSTFTLGQFGGHGGRALRVGDVLPIKKLPCHSSATVSNHEMAELLQLKTLAADLIPGYTHHWQIGVLYGPHGAPDFFTEADIEMFFSTDWEVHYNSNNTGIRLIGPKPQWARQDGGEAGLHPSNIHDNAYAIGAVDFTGDMPVILGPDGPSLGGFVCPVTIVQAELWKIGQLKAGDKIRFFAISQQAAADYEQAQNTLVADFCLPVQEEESQDALGPVPGMADRFGKDSSTAFGMTGYITNLTSLPIEWEGQGGGEQLPASKNAANTLPSPQPSPLKGEGANNLGGSPILAEISVVAGKVKVGYRQAGDKYLLVEYGDLVLDLNMRFRVHALMQQLLQQNIPGIIDLTPGIRSLQVHYESRILPVSQLLDILQQAEADLPPVETMQVPTRIVHLPLSWDDAATQLAIEKYKQSVRKDAPWCEMVEGHASNIEFIRRINGLDSVNQVKDIVFNASYLTLGLGDVYLGAPVATPLDPRHRLVTTKYNPARTWTPENAVGIGGAYLCIYGMEGPGGYQFVGRTIQMWNRWRTMNQTSSSLQPNNFTENKPWLLRFFDQIRFYPVSATDLLQMRADFLHDKFQLQIEESTFSLKDYNDFLTRESASISAFKTGQQAAFNAERERWIINGQANYQADSEALSTADENLVLAANERVVASHVAGNLWKIEVQVGDIVEAGRALVIVESMKMEISVNAPTAGRISRVLCSAGSAVAAGQNLIIIEELTKN